MVITPHAIERFVKRIVPDHSYEDARTLLVNRIESAVPLKQKTFAGQELWKITEPNALLIVKRDKCPVIVTVVESQDEEDMPPELMERLVQQYEQDQQQYDLDEQVKQAAGRLRHEHGNMCCKIKSAQKKIREARDTAHINYRSILSEYNSAVITALNEKKLIPNLDE